MNGFGIFASARVATGGGLAATFMQATTDPANLTTYTFASQNIGTAAAGRRVVVAISSTSSRAVSSATIGGVSATIDATNVLTGTARVAIISAVVPTGTTASVVVTMTGACNYMGIGLWTINGSTPTGNTANGNGNPTTLTVTTNPGDIVLVVSHTSGQATAAWGWTNATERWNSDIETSTETFDGADGVASGSSLAISATTGTTTSVGTAAAYA